MESSETEDPKAQPQSKKEWAEQACRRKLKFGDLDQMLAP